MKITPQVKNILKNYDSEKPAIIKKLYEILMHGKLSGTGTMVIESMDKE
jgi:class I fructose-bisphosphate aldolase